MSSPKAPPAHTAVQTTTSGPTSEVLVTELTGSTVIAGNLHMLFSLIRPVFQKSADGTVTVSLVKEEALRVVMPLATVPDAAEQLRQIAAAVQNKAGQSAAKPN